MKWMASMDGSTDLFSIDQLVEVFLGRKVFSVDGRKSTSR